MSERTKEEKQDRSKHKKKKRKREKELDTRHVFKLLNLAATNRHVKLEKLLKYHSDLDIDSFNSEGHTALHQAARFGHGEAVESLLRLGADAKAEDFQGNTPAHLAAAKKHISTLALLLQAREPVDLDAANSFGMTIRELMQVAIEDQATTAHRHAAAKLKCGSALSTSYSEEEEDSEDDWAKKIQENAGFDDFASSTADWDSFEYSSFGAAGGHAEPEDEDGYARKMWEGMQRRKAEAQGPSAATAETWAKADNAQAKQRKAAEDAAANSRRILDEEQARDQAWRQAVLQGDLGARRAGYEAKWHVFAASSDPISHATVPWLVHDKDDARGIILYGTSGPAEERKRLRLELMRWHPDKFVAKFGKRLVAGDRSNVLDGVKRVSQMLNELNANGG